MYKGSNHFKLTTKNQSELLTHIIERIYSDKNQSEVARMIGDYTIDGDVIGKFKRGERVIPPRCFMSIAKGLKIPERVLFDTLVRDYAESLQKAIEEHNERMGLTDKIN